MPDRKVSICMGTRRCAVSVPVLMTNAKSSCHGSVRELRRAEPLAAASGKHGGRCSCRTGGDNAGSP